MNIHRMFHIVLWFDEVIYIQTIDHRESFSSW